MKASLSYLSNLPKYDVEKPYELWLDEVPAQIPWTNCMFKDESEIEFNDARAQDVQLDYDSFGFKYLSHPLTPRLKSWQFWEDRSSRFEYLRDCIDLVRKEFRADKVICYDWRV